MSNIGSKWTPRGRKAMLLGSGELGKEVALELQRMGVEVVACDKYADAPAMQVADKALVFNMLDADALRENIKREKPDHIIPEVEAIATPVLVELEKEGYNVTPTANAAFLTMNREGIRRLAAEELGLTTSPYRFASDYDEFVAAVKAVGIPCVVKPIMSSSGHGQSVIKSEADIESNWKLAEVDPMVTAGVRCEGFRVEMIIRGYLAGSAWREYAAGAREICGVKLPEGLKENQKLPEPIITPTTKADEGHDMNISAEEIIAQGLVSAEDYAILEKYTRELFRIGTEMAAERGLILVDTKYEFGKYGDKVLLIDEIHTPDSSRYFYSDTYQELFDAGKPQRQLSKEFVRQWLISEGFMGQPGQKVPEMTPAVCKEISERYIELYEHVTGQKFVPASEDNAEQRIEKNVLDFLANLDAPKF